MAHGVDLATRKTPIICQFPTYFFLGIYRGNLEHCFGFILLLCFQGDTQDQDYSVYLAMEEINKNDHILPNISLLVNIECGLELYGERTGLAFKSEEFIPNYYCRNHRKYLIVLTTPNWGVSTSIGHLLYISRIPEVSHVKIILRK